MLCSNHVGCRVATSCTRDSYFAHPVPSIAGARGWLIPCTVWVVHPLHVLAMPTSVPLLRVQQAVFVVVWSRVQYVGFHTLARTWSWYGMLCGAPYLGLSGLLSGIRDSCFARSVLLTPSARCLLIPFTLCGVPFTSCTRGPFFVAPGVFTLGLRWLGFLVVQ